MSLRLWMQPVHLRTYAFCVLCGLLQAPSCCLYLFVKKHVIGEELKCSYMSCWHWYRLFPFNWLLYHLSSLLFCSPLGVTSSLSTQASEVADSISIAMHWQTTPSNWIQYTMRDATPLHPNVNCLQPSSSPSSQITLPHFFSHHSTPSIHSVPLMLNPVLILHSISLESVF